jgi:hypothetical protein
VRAIERSIAAPILLQAGAEPLDHEHPGERS